MTIIFALQFFFYIFSLICALVVSRWEQVQRWNGAPVVHKSVVQSLSIFWWMTYSYFIPFYDGTRYHGMYNIYTYILALLVTIFKRCLLLWSIAPIYTCGQGCLFRDCVLNRVEWRIHFRTFPKLLIRKHRVITSTWCGTWIVVA